MKLRYLLNKDDGISEAMLLPESFYSSQILEIHVPDEMLALAASNTHLPRSLASTRAEVGTAAIGATVIMVRMVLTRPILG